MKLGPSLFQKAISSMAENSSPSKQQKKMEETLAEREETLSEGEDRISELPDSILGHVLSLLCSTREAIRTSVFSKRWQYLWASIPVLIIREREADICNDNGGFFSSVDRTLARRGHNKLHKFAFLTERCWYIEKHHSHINRWISYALCCNVEELIIRGFPLKCDALSKLPCLKKLYLNNCNCNWELIGEINWKNLKSLHISRGRLTRKSISNILTGSPSLETLELCGCSGLDGLNITSTCLRKLIVNDHYSSDVIEIEEFKIKAPNILSLEIKGFIKSEIMLVDVGSVVEATLDFKMPMIPWTANGMGKVTLKKMIESLTHVNELKIGLNCREDLMSLEMKNWSSPISKCKYLQMNLVEDGASPTQEIKFMASSTPPSVFMNERASDCIRQYDAIIWFVLKNASALEKIVIRASPECGLKAQRLQSLLRVLFDP